LTIPPCICYNKPLEKRGSFCGGRKDEKKTVLLTVVVWLCTGGLAGAVLIEPYDYPNGTVLTASAEEVILSATASDNQPVSIWPVTADIDPFGYAPTGQMVFSHAHICFWNTDRRLRMDFAQPVSTIQLTAGGGSIFTSCQGRLEVYDIHFNLLDVYQTAPLTANQFETMLIFRPANDIYHAIAYSTGSNSFGRLDHLEFAIPEPYSLLLLVGGAAIARWKRQWV